MIPLTLQQISAAVGGVVIGDKSATLTSVSTNSREIAPGALFVPLKGDTFDGHNYIESAVSSGAAAFLTEHEPSPDMVNAPYIIVTDTKAALLALAAYYRNLLKCKVVAVTGSAGKTSVKDAIFAVLSKKYSVHKTKGNLNNDIGMPLTIFGIEPWHEVAVLEMGMNHSGEISTLSRAARPDIAVITNVLTAHIENLKSREGILSAKMEMVDGMVDSGVLVVNYDNDMLRTVSDVNPRVVRVSAQEDASADVYIKNINRKHMFYSAFTICYNGIEFGAEVDTVSPELIQNALLAATVGLLMDVSTTDITDAIASKTRENGRLQVSERGTGVVIDDTYNANPDSMRLALDTLAMYTNTKAAILGDMLELGDFSEQFHKDVGRYAAEVGVDFLYAVGNDARHYKSAFDAVKGDERKSYYFENKEDFFHAVSTVNVLAARDLAILVKGSRGMKMEQIVQKIL